MIHLCRHIFKPVFSIGLIDENGCKIYQPVIGNEAVG